MDHDPDLRKRLEQLEQLLVQYRPWFHDGTGDDVEAVTARIGTTLQRLLQLTAAMQRRDANGDDPPDALESVTIRLMLEDYASVLSDLRAVVRSAERQLSSVAAVVHDGGRIVREERKRQAG